MEYTKEDMENIEYFDKCAKEFELLVEAVQKINQEAAKYLRENVKYEDKHGHLGFVLIWASTPQGHDYWRDIYRKLRERGYYETIA